MTRNVSCSCRSAHGPCSCRVWEVRLGHVRLLLLDTDLAQNAPWDRELSARLYGGGQDTRLQQEVVLGLGGVLALRALGIQPAAWHLNEGHAAFVVLQRLRDRLASGDGWEDALAEVRRTTIFTTHTPVPAGHDAFPFHMVEQQLANCWGSINGNASQFLALGHYDNGQGPQFNMTALAMRSAGVVNAVSRLHGEVTRNMFARSGRTCRKTSVRSARSRTACTSRRGCRAPWVACSNGIWRLAGATCTKTRRSGNASSRSRTRSYGPLATSCARTSCSSRAIARANDGVEELMAPGRILSAGVLLENTTLTIGFARRFTGYKRPDLVFRDPERLARLMTAAGRPVQFVFAGQGPPGRRCGQAPFADGAASRARSQVQRAASRSSTTTTCTWRSISCRAATSGSTPRESRWRPAARAA